MGKKVCVIGAGCSGITAVKNLVDEGLEPTCFEMKDNLGGVFYDFRATGSHSIVYDNTVLTVSNQTMAFSDLPPLGEARNHWHWTEYNAYLRKYVDFYNLEQHIRFDVQVVECVSSDGGSKWTVTTECTKTKARASHAFDALVVCSGTHRVPKFPEIQGQEAFEAAGGQVHHSSNYKSPAPYKGKRVLVIGCGESGADIVREIGETADQTHLSVRRLPVIVPRNVLKGRYLTTDGLDTPSRSPQLFTMWFSKPAAIAFGIIQLAVTLVAFLLSVPAGWVGYDTEAANDTWKEGNSRRLARDNMDVDTPERFEDRLLISKWRLQTWPLLDWYKHTKFFTKNASFVPLITDGKIKVNQSGFCHLEPGKIVFKDGKQEEIDVVMCCTGYQDTFEFLKTEWGADRINVRTLYKHSIHTDYNNLALCGWARPANGGIPTCSELQARLFARVLSGKHQLPERTKLKKIVAMEQQKEVDQFEHTPGVNTLVSYFDYAPALAKLIGCQPSFWTLISDPVLLYQFMHGGHTSSWYRISGPHSTPGVSKAHIKSLPTAFGVGFNIALALATMGHVLGLRGQNYMILESILNGPIWSHLFKNKSALALNGGFCVEPALEALVAEGFEKDTLIKGVQKDSAKKMM